MRRKIAAGNWKMNGTRASRAVLEALVRDHGDTAAEVIICPPAPLIPILADAAGAFSIGGQDCHAAASGPHTGDISAETLKDCGASHVIVGHSERRADHGESDADVLAKAEAAYRAGLVAIICVGETEAERDAGQTTAVVARQIEGSVTTSATAENTVIAYEPVWAIGTGRTPSIDEIAETHAALRAMVAKRLGSETAAAMRLLYGGSVKPGNAAEIFALEDVDGGLVGGASLKAEDFGPIIDAAAG
ncbi:triose-phosphate isomerase [Oceanibium sediminis]|uniref:triose-phosphate isomerase n=1 Tax=Oceanibium sediminis TaxID=2026339 RepID=UPI000DD49109|nr:triose-phosphate isomerase [Oceanibium sediminis]